MTDSERIDGRPLISVIVPVYNTIEYLPRCIESIQNQTYDNLEIILVDDGSTDGSGAVCDEYAGKDKRIRVIHQENGGTAAALNTGLNKVTGAYIGFCGCDDWLELDMYEYLLETIKQTQADAAQCKFADEKLLKQNELKPTVLEGGEAFFENVVTGRKLQNLTWSLQLNLYCAHIWKDLRFTEGFTYEDAIIFAEIVQRVKRWTITYKGLYNYFIRDDSISHGPKTVKHLKSIEKALDVYYELYEKDLSYKVIIAHLLCQRTSGYIWMLHESGDIDKNMLILHNKKRYRIFRSCYKDAVAYAIRKPNKKPYDIIRFLYWIMYYIMPTVAMKFNEKSGIKA